MTNPKAKPPLVREVAHDLSELRKQVVNNERIMGRIHRGTSSAHTKIAQNDRKHQALAQQVKNLEQRFLDAQAAGDPDDPRFDAINQELERLDKRVGNFYQDLQSQIAMVQEAVDELEGRVDNHDDRLDAIDGPDGQLTTLRNVFGVEIHGNTERTRRDINTILANPQDEVSYEPWTFPVAIGAFLFFLFMFGCRVFDIGLTGTTTVGKAKGSTDAHLSAPWWFGVGVGLLVAGIIIVSGKVSRTRFGRLRMQSTPAPQAAPPAPAQPPVNPPNNGNNVGLDILDSHDGHTRQFTQPQQDAPQSAPRS